MRVEARKDVDAMTDRFELLALDVDGTLVGEDMVVRPRMRRALDAARQRGVRVALCTGRALPATQRFMRELALDTPPVVFNGALVPSLDGGPPVVHRPLAADAVEMLVEAVRRTGDHLELYTVDAYYIERLGAIGLYQQEKLGFDPVVGPFGDLWHHETILKAQLIISGETERPRIEALGRALASQAMFSWGVSPGFDGYFVNVMQPGVDKCVALDALLRALGIPWERVLAAGDSPSDLAYVRRAGLGFIMANAPEAVRRAAPRIAPHVDEDGLAEVIERHVLNGQMPSR
jgi:Cof subfamily protein (haloacid dehalogenase superfamily)